MVVSTRVLGVGRLNYFWLYQRSGIILFLLCSALPEIWDHFFTMLDSTSDLGSLFFILCSTLPAARNTGRFLLLYNFDGNSAFLGGSGD